MIPFLKKRLDDASAKLEAGPDPERVREMLRRSAAYSDRPHEVETYRAEIAERWRLEALFWRAYALLALAIAEKAGRGAALRSEQPHA